MWKGSFTDLINNLKYFTLLQGVAIFNTLLSSSQIIVNLIIYLICMEVSYTFISYQKKYKK